MTTLRSYHHVWLESHRNRTEEWLCERLADGFDIHHIDGDGDNDSPANLVLIECGDHMRLHGHPNFLRIGMESQKRRRAEQRLRTAAIAYTALSEGHDWRSLERLTGYGAAYGERLARQYAKTENLRWPVRPKPSRPDGLEVLEPDPEARPKKVKP